MNRAIESCIGTMQVPQSNHTTFPEFSTCPFMPETSKIKAIVLACQTIQVAAEQHARKQLDLIEVQRELDTDLGSLDVIPVTLKVLGFLTCMAW